MGSFFDRNRATRDECARKIARPFVEEMVSEQEAVTGSRMLAYTLVGRRLRKSAGWVRKLVGRYDVGLSADTYFAITEAYQAHVARMEARAAAKRERAAKLMEEALAIRSGRARPVLGDRDGEIRPGLPGLDDVAP